MNALAWNSKGSLLISGSDDTRVYYLLLLVFVQPGPDDRGILFMLLQALHVVGSISRKSVFHFINEMIPLAQINVWSYGSGKLLHSVETGHTANIFCTKFVPETSDELVVSGAGDSEVIFFLCDEHWQYWIMLLIFKSIYVLFEILVGMHLLISFQVRLFHLSRLSGRSEEHAPSAVFRCHTKRVKKLAVRYHL